MLPFRKALSSEGVAPRLRPGWILSKLIFKSVSQGLECSSVGDLARLLHHKSPDLIPAERGKRKERGMKGGREKYNSGREISANQAQVCGSVGKHWLALLQGDLDLVPSKRGGVCGWQRIVVRPQTYSKCPVSNPHGLDVSLEKSPELSAKYKCKAQQRSVTHPSPPTCCSDSGPGCRG